MKEYFSKNPPYYIEYIEDDVFCYISIDHNIVSIHLEPPEGFVALIQAFWVYKPFPKEKKEGLQYFSHLIVDGESIIINGEERRRRYCPDVDYFVLEGDVTNK
jgi:hypothetical protein